MAFPLNLANINKNNACTDTLTHTQNQKQKWATFTYTGKETKYITQIFKNTDTKVAFKTKNSFKAQLNPEQQKQNKYA
jgi:hypothetical protein